MLRPRPKRSRSVWHGDTNSLTRRFRYWRMHIHQPTATLILEAFEKSQLPIHFFDTFKSGPCRAFHMAEFLTFDTCQAALKSSLSSTSFRQRLNDQLLMITSWAIDGAGDLSQGLGDFAGSAAGDQPTAPAPAPWSASPAIPHTKPAQPPISFALIPSQSPGYRAWKKRKLGDRACSERGPLQLAPLYGPPPPRARRNPRCFSLACRATNSLALALSPETE
jgi:hypothetical protein